MSPWFCDEKSFFDSLVPQLTEKRNVHYFSELHNNAIKCHLHVRSFTLCTSENVMSFKIMLLNVASIQAKFRIKVTRSSCAALSQCPPVRRRKGMSCPYYSISTSHTYFLPPKRILHYMASSHYGLTKWSILLRLAIPQLFFLYKTVNGFWAIFSLQFQIFGENTPERSPLPDMFQISSGFCTGVHSSFAAQIPFFNFNDIVSGVIALPFSCCRFQKQVLHQCLFMALSRKQRQVVR